MAQFNQLVLTDKGAALLAKIQQSARPLIFIYAEAGDGVLPQGQSLQSLTALISKKKDLAITSIVNEGNGSIKISLESVSNAGLVQGMYIREIGLYATDPDEGNILYAVANAGNNADFLPPYSINPVEELINLVISVGQATTVKATIDQSMVYVTKSELPGLIKLPNIKVSNSNSTIDIPSSGTPAVIAFNNVIYGNSPDILDNGQIKIKKSGKYRVSASVQWLASNGTGTRYIQIRVNSAPKMQDIKAGMVDGHGQSFSTSMHLNANDIVNFDVSQNSGSTVQILGGLEFSPAVCLECFELD